MASRQIGNYRILEYVGSGGFGSVFKAEDIKAPGRIVAIKELHKKHTRSASIKQRFFQEAVAMARLDHSNLPRLYTFGEDSGCYYLVMEFVSGVLLSESIQKEGRLSAELSRTIMMQVLQAVGYSHRNGIIHRDLKPENIMILNDRDSLHVKVLDFGIARLVGGENLTMTGEGFGTPAYMSPERIAGGESIDQRTDIYSAGIILYEMLTGKPPFESRATDPMVFWAEMRTLHESQPLPPLDQFGVPADLDTAVKRATAKEAADRYATAEEMLAAIGGTAMTSRLLITTAPGGAEVHIDNILRGSSDHASGKLLVEGLASGLHNVKVSKQGYEGYQINISLDAAAEVPLQVSLAARSTVPMPQAQETTPIASGDSAKTALLVVEHVPEGSFVSVGGKALLPAGEDERTTVQVAAGNHELSVKSPSGTVRSRLVTVTDKELGSSITITLPWQSQEPQTFQSASARPNRLLPILLSIAVLFALAAAAYFVFRGQTAPEQQPVAAITEPVSQTARPPAATDTVSSADTSSSPIESDKSLPKQDTKKEQTKSEETPVQSPVTSDKGQQIESGVQADAAADSCATVSVIDRSGAPAAGIRVGCVEYVRGAATALRHGRTGPRGAWRVCGLTAGSTVKVSVFAPGGATLGSTESTIRKGQNFVSISLPFERDEDSGMRRRRPGIFRRP